MKFEVGDVVRIKDVDQMKTEGIRIDFLPRSVIDRAGQQVVVSEVFPENSYSVSGLLLSGFGFRLFHPEYLELMRKKTEANMIGLSKIVLGKSVCYSMVRYCNGHSLPINVEEYETSILPIVLGTQNITITKNIQSLGLKVGDVLEGIIKEGLCYVPNKLPFIGVLAQDEYKVI